MTRRGGTIRDVARETGLSTATISRVMNGGARVSVATRQKVLAACDRLDYLPNPAARALSTARSKTIAAIIPTIEHSVYAKFVSAVEATLANLGYSLVIAIADPNGQDEETAVRKLLGMGAEAVILSGAAHDSRVLDLLNRRRVPHMFTSVWDPASQPVTVGYANADLAFRALTYLIDKGHTRIGVLHGPVASNDRAAQRRAGAQAAAQGRATLHLTQAALSVAGGKQATQDMLARKTGCTALLCFSDVLALGAYFALQQNGLRVPNDVSVMGFDNLDWSRDACPPLTTIDLPATQMGDRVAQQLVAHLETGAALVGERIDCDIVERASVRRLG